MSTEKGTISIGYASSHLQFSGDMLVFRGLVILVLTGSEGGSFLRYRIYFQEPIQLDRLQEIPKAFTRSSRYPGIPITPALSLRRSPRWDDPSDKVAAAHRSFEKRRTIFQRRGCSRIRLLNPPGSPQNDARDSELTRLVTR